MFPAFFQTELKPEEIGAALGMFFFASSCASSIFMAVTDAMLHAGGDIKHTFYLAAALVAFSMILGFIGLRIPKESHAKSENTRNQIADHT